MNGAGAAAWWLAEFLWSKKKGKSFFTQLFFFLLFNFFFLFLAGRNWTEEIFLQPSFHVFTNLGDFQLLLCDCTHVHGVMFLLAHSLS